MESTTINKIDLIAYNSNVPKISEYSSVESLVVDIQQMLERCASIYYGIRAGLLDDALVESVIAEIVKRFGKLTVRDIEHSFERAVIVKDDWRNLTKREMISPIETWWNKKEAIRIEFEKYKLADEELEHIKEAEEKFKQQSLCVYRESLLQLKWLGTIFQASSIAREIANYIDEPIRKKLWNESVDEKNRLIKHENEMKKYNKKFISEKFGHSTLRIYSEMLINEAIKQNIEI